MLRVTMLDPNGRRVPATSKVFSCGVEAARFMATIPAEKQPQIESSANKGW